MTSQKKPAATTCLRAAKKSDAYIIAQLDNIASAGLSRFLWSQEAEEGEEPIAAGARAITDENTGFCYKNAIIAETKDSIAGMVMCYGIRSNYPVFDAARHHEILRPFLELDTLAAGTFNIDALAVFPRYRNCGLGKKLLAAASARAAGMNIKRLSLSVFDQNEAAMRFYLREGFGEMARKAVVPHKCYPYDRNIILMTREVASHVTQEDENDQ